ncbi:MAG: DNA polymerase I [Ruminococcaceae bacterium]|nr:DNA polymerase I [Oscillospiraceae bacterium]
MKKLLIIDSNSLINRAFYGVRFLSSSDGTPTNAVYGFFMTLMKLIDDFKPDYICAAFDLKAPTFRHKMFADYKAQRKPMPDGLREQMPICKEILRKMNIRILEQEGFEADDIIGTISQICEKNEVECLIATGDKDDLQLASKSTKVLLTVTKSGVTETESIDEDGVMEKYGVTPTQFIDVKGLMGDTSDNIPGVAGIGEKTALSLISKAKSIENLYENIDTFGITAGTLKKLEAGKDMAFLSKTLATIDKNVPIAFEFESSTLSDFSENEGLYEALKKLDLNKLITRMGVKKSEIKPSVDFLSGTKTLVIDTKEEFLKFAKSAKELGEVSCVFELYDGKISACGMAVERIGASIFPDESFRAEFEEFLADKSVKKYCADVKDTLVNNKIEGIAGDIAISAYLVNPARPSYSQETLAMEYLGYEFEAEKQVSLFGDSGEILAKKALSVMPIHRITCEKLKEKGQESLYQDVELPLIEVLAGMQKQGILIDQKQLSAFSEYLKERIESLTDSIYAHAGGEFNINSPKQLGEILFEKLGLKSVKKTKTGYSTNAEVLEKLKGEHSIVEEILEYRSLAKLKSTYCDGLMAVINPNTGRIHSVFNQTVTVTGRISSTEPNMQNIPTRTELGSQIRKMFVAKPGCVLIDADYSQIELRVLAHIAKDETMINAFKNNEDIHSVTASQVLGIPQSEVTKEQRSSAKAVNFGIVYGIGEYSLSQDLKISVKQAKAYIESYLQKYNGVREYMENIKADAKEKGYVTTMMNRIRYVPEITSSNFQTRSFGERVALNTPIQGSAADIIKLAMVRIYKKLKDGGFGAKLILQVHDELIIESPREEVEAVSKILSEEMEKAVTLSVPLVVDMSEGESWYDAK